MEIFAIVVLFIILLTIQHLYNWFSRFIVKTIGSDSDLDDDGSASLFFIVTIVYLGLNIGIIATLIDWIKQTQ